MHHLYGKIINEVRNTKIKTRLFVSFLFISIVPILIIGVISYNNSTNAIKSKISTYSVQILNQASKNMYSKVKAFEDFGDELCYSNIIQNCLSEYAQNGKSDYLEKANIAVDLNNYILSRTSQLMDIYDIEILGEDQTALYGMGYHTLIESNIQKYAMLATKKTGAAAWSYANLNGHNTIIIAKQIYSLYSREKIGYLFMAIEEKSFSNIYNDINIGEGTDIFVIDQMGTIVSSKNSDMNIGGEYSEKDLKTSIENYDKNGVNVFQMRIGGKKNLIVFSYIKDTGWYLVSSIPFSYLNSELFGIKWKIVCVSIIAVLLSIILSLLISSSIVQPLNKLVLLMKQAKSGNLTVVEAAPQNDEVGYLQENFNVMITRIAKLIDQNKAEQIEKREIEMQMLQAQITPHFLFNTLNSLKWVAKMSQADSVSDGIGALARLLKNTIINTNELTTIKTELKNIDDYAIIQKIRYGSFFDIEYHIADEISECMILKFLLQPIVENSIIHSLEGVDHNVLIHILCEEAKDEIKITISDNGKGMDEKTQNEIINSKGGSKSSLSGIGIGNVRDRIKLCFGKEYGLSLQSTIGVGTIVTVTIPIIKREGDEQ